MRLRTEQERIQKHLNGEQVLDFLEGTYWDAEHYISEVLDRPEGIFNMWDSRYVKVGTGSLVVTERRLIFVPDEGGTPRAGTFAESPRDKSAPSANALAWVTFNPVETIKVPEQHCIMISFDGRYLPKYDEFGFFATDSPRVKAFSQEVERSARSARRGA
ncbi:hypothetical protein ISU10_02490 [Nocardioides agariphilus]|uniref:Uncharacterized protein n=1 Tax=Nocardioides agariphilus TaxID=433664 RepID=A0A930YH55_9ACTN|nr:hypothetical protein [Nocardioides agariphilus]MBF4766633.1 hypothetical protein [Nocardioides agariphilus]